ncbi:hypothetical protein MESS4_30022 [Mesorhizobium sp. STM 4661]|nr:hypothetical protein MESS4_30022 [Mesorhizobium sp. STM 4661]
MRTCVRNSFFAQKVSCLSRKSIRLLTGVLRLSMLTNSQVFFLCSLSSDLHCFCNGQ